MFESGRLSRSVRWSVLLLLPALALAASGLASPEREEASRRIVLKPCHLKDFEEEVRCGTLRVFENRQARSGRTIDLLSLGDVGGQTLVRDGELTVP